MFNVKRCTGRCVNNISSLIKCANEHIANNHIIICLICQSKSFQGTWCKDKAVYTHFWLHCQSNLQHIKTICLYVLSSNTMDKISSKYDLEPIFRKFKRMYFNRISVFINVFSYFHGQKYLFLKLRYRPFNQEGISDKKLL